MVAYSTLVYLFSDRYVDKARFQGEEVPCKGNKVKQDELAVKLVAASISWLNENNNLKLDIGKRSKMLGLRKIDTVIINKIGTPGLPSSSLESVLWDKAKKNDNLFDLTSRIIGRSKRNNPESVIINIVKDHLADEGYLEKKKKMLLLTEYIPDCNRISELEDSLEEIPEIYSSIKNNNLYKKIIGDINSGIKNMTQVDVD
ncbi:hypothetical protein GF319_03575 [Candidatus Bathyarchaeota archaeon]|nr:hypothetical protein [Candidatus Bathyarchaeota archaeon]